MRLTHQKREVGKPTLNMASMIDVVFLLLIFFMCTSAFKAPERNLPSPLPRVGGPRMAVEEFEPVRIVVQPVGDGVLISCDGQPCTSFAQLREQLEARRRIADLPVIIEGRRGVRFRHMVAALDTCYQADLRRAAFSARGIGNEP